MGLYLLTTRAALFGLSERAIFPPTGREALAEEVADLFILLLGTAISADFDLKEAFWTKMDELMDRKGRMVEGRVRVSRFRGVDEE